MTHPDLCKVQVAVYWRATANSDDSAVAWSVNFRDGTIVLNSTPNQNLYWCMCSAEPIETY